MTHINLKLSKLYDPRKADLLAIVEDVKGDADDFDVLQSGRLVLWVVLHNAAPTIDLRHLQAAVRIRRLVGHLEG